MYQLFYVAEIIILATIATLYIKHIWNQAKHS